MLHNNQLQAVNPKQCSLHSTFRFDPVRDYPERKFILHKGSLVVVIDLVVKI